MFTSAGKDLNSGKYHGGVSAGTHSRMILDGDGLVEAIK